MVVMRKGPWTEQEDMQLVCFVGLFGDRRWDFIAKVSGLNRTGKSCRLRWVNYLHPGLKRGRITPQEERLIIELHSRWGNRWSRIARRLPGRTDNEIKNYWRTHMRKKAQERKRKLAAGAGAAAVSSSSSSSLTDTSGGEPQPAQAVVVAAESAHEELRCSSSSSSTTSSSGMTGALGEMDDAGAVKAYSMDQFWNELPMPADMAGGGPCFEEFTTMPSPMWDHYPLWKMDDNEDFQALKI